VRIPILYEDNHLLIVQKPVNIPVQGDCTGDDDLLSMLKRDLKVRYQKPGNVYLGLIHRLDRPVGGVMVFAKTSKAASRLSDAVRRRAIDRGYLAVVWGAPPENQGMLEHYLIKDSRENKVFTVPPHHKNAKKAVLKYKTIAKTKNLSLLYVELHTGRPHQIRVQLSAVGCPLYGDQKYGQQYNRAGQQIAL
jgi:23S rRNA pseudouridine1911/1915/1917 synthase